MSQHVVIVHNADISPAGVPRVDIADVANAAADIARALVAAGIEVEIRALPDAPEALGAFVAGLAAAPPDLVFNLCESLGGHARHEVIFPSLLDLCNIPYSGSGPLALGLSLHKDVARRLLSAAGVPTPEGAAVSDAATAMSGFPLMVKPSREDASVGISRRSVVTTPAELEAQLAAMLADYGPPVVVERFISGREIYVSLVGNGDSVDAVGLHEMDFSKLPAGYPPIVCYDAKWNLESPEFLGTNSVAVEIDAAARARLVDVARRAFVALGLRDYARIDLRVDGAGQPYVIDVNPNCDLSDGAGMCRAASFDGLGYAALVRKVFDVALARVARESASYATGGSALVAAAPDVTAPSAPDRPPADPGAGLAGRPLLDGGRGSGDGAGRRSPDQPRR